MESGFITIVNSLIDKGIIADTSLFLIVAGLLIYGFRYWIKPMYDMLREVPTVDVLKEVVEENAEVEELNVEEMSKKLEKIVEVLDKVEDLGRGNYRETRELRKDIEQIKQILNQFQGHLMYGGRSGDFGNRELK